MRVRRILARIGVVGLSLLALCLGLALGTTACLCDCPEPDEIVAGNYVIAQSERPELVGGRVDVQPESVTILYTLDGVEWTVEYMVDLE